jgi:hypothetical protein
METRRRNRLNRKRRSRQRRAAEAEREFVAGTLKPYLRLHAGNPILLSGLVTRRGRSLFRACRRRGLLGPHP